MSQAVLVIQAARFGDLVQTGRLARSLSETGRSLHLAVDAGLAPLARLLYPRAVIHGLPFHGGDAGLDERKAALAPLLDTDFAAVYNCNFSPLTAALCRMFEPGRVTGYRPAPVSQGGILRSPWCRVAFRLSERRRATPLNLVDYWANFCDCPMPPPQVNPIAKAGGRGLGIAVAGRESRRSLPVEALAEASGTAFRALGGPKVRIFGTAAEERRARKLMRLLPAAMLEKTADLCGRTDWAALYEEMSGLDLLICPDTGLMHLAAALGVPTLAFFLSSAWCHETGPYGEGHIIFQAAPDCAPCLESAPCGRGEICRQPFADPRFGRAVALALTDRQTSGKWPAGLQLWRSGLDSLGARLVLQAGTDRFAGMRRELRDSLKNRLGFAPSGQASAGLAPAAEWMLPPWRYC